jgi:sigma-B regulation protein RsbU (phosphoserine phosphatase)
MVNQSPDERLALLYRVSQTFNSSLDLDRVLDLVMDEVIATTGAERGFLMLYDDGGELVFAAARGMDRQTIETPEFQVSRGVVDRVAREGQPVLTSNALVDERLGGRASIIGLGLRSILCVPLLLKGQSLGLIYVDNRLQAGIFGQDDLDLLASIASSAAIGIENARLYQVAREKGRMERELQMARQVQANLIPSKAPSLPGWEVVAWWKPARTVSGDFYDFVETGPERLGIVLADVSDKGMPAALFMASSRTILRASVLDAGSPAEGIARANRLVCQDAPDGMFVTLVYGELEPATGQMCYVCAGHYPPLFYHSASDRLSKLEWTGMALGLDPQATFQSDTIHLKPGDFVLMYTDGVIDATDLQGEAYGQERFRHLLLEHRDAPAADIVAALRAALERFVGGSPPFDDVTLVVVKRQGRRT